MHGHLKAQAHEAAYSAYREYDPRATVEEGLAYAAGHWQEYIDSESQEADEPERLISFAEA